METIETAVLFDPDLLQATREYYDSAPMVAHYTEEQWYHYLIPGERSVFATHFPRGFTRERVLDLGCAGGRLTHFFHEHGADNVIGVDISPKQIAAARQRAPHLDFRVGDVTELEFPKHSFTVAMFANNGLAHVYPKEAHFQALREVWRVLSPGGLFIFSQPNLPALFLSWYNNMRLHKLRFRITEILRGNVFRKEAYLSAVHPPHLNHLYAWPHQVMTNARSVGFTFVALHSNSRILRPLQRYLGTDVLTRCADPWPYFVFRKEDL